MKLMERTLSLETLKLVGKKVKLCGWVDRRRDHGQLVFIDLKDRSGIVQIVGKKNLGDLRISDVIEIEGLVRKRPEKLINPRLPTGCVEIGAEKIKILARSKDLPFDIHGDGREIGEETRLKYRYLDLRRPRLIQNLKLRDKYITHVREFLQSKDFVEIETPMLTKSTPEGSRDFIVPSRLQKGKFYALPQSPQQYKQLLMVAGLERYFQIARCLRDEDLRADRGFEHTQIDLEMSFVQREDVMNLIEELMIYCFEKMGKKIFQKPFPRFSQKEALKKFGADKFDIRPKKDPNLMGFAWVIDFPVFEKDQDGNLTYSHNPFTAPREGEEKKLLLNKDLLNITSQQYDLVLNGHEIGGGGIRIRDPKVLSKVFEVLGHTKEEIKQKFGHILEAFEYGVPPHGGIALGIDRHLMIICNEDAMRDVVAFPTTSSGQTSIMDAPSQVSPEQLKELGLSINDKKKRK